MFIDAVTNEPATGKPVKVVTKVRNVIYHKVQRGGRDGVVELSSTTGKEIAQEVLTTPENVECLGEPMVERDTKHVTEYVRRSADDYKRSNAAGFETRD